MVADKRYIEGSHYKRCDRSGMKIRSFDALKEWNGLWVRKESFETRNAQDFVRGVYDDQRVEEPRSTPTPSVLGPLTTTLTADAAAGATTLTVESTTRWSNGDTVWLICGFDGSTMHRTSITNVVDTTHLTIAEGLPKAAPSGNLVTNVTAQAVVTAASL